MKNFWKLNRLVVLFISFGFLVLSFEIYLQHYDLLGQKKIMWTPIIFGFLGGLIGISIVIFFNKASYYLFVILMVLSSLVGTLGLILHNRWRFPAFTDLLLHHKSFPFEMLTVYSPFLAPSAFIGISCIGLVVAIFEKWTD